MNLYILDYNNYYNRTIKKENNLQDYLNYLIYTLPNTNFNESDGITTIKNIGTGSSPYDGTGDYVVAADEYNNIISRWFIIDSVKTRKGQYTVTLRRDVVADNYNEIITAPCFIEKATLQTDDPLVFNDEDMTFNQIKTKEILLKDKTDDPWIVGYYAKDFTGDKLKGSVKGNNLVNVPHKVLDVTDITDWVFYGYEETPIKFIDKRKETCNISIIKTGSANNFQYKINTYNGEVTFDRTTKNTYLSSNATPSTLSNLLGAAAESFGLDQLHDEAAAYYETTINTESLFEDFIGYSTGDIVKTSGDDGKYYELTIVPVQSVTIEEAVAAGSLYNSLTTIVNNTGIINGSPNLHSFTIGVTASSFNIKLTERTDLEVTFDMTNHLLTDDAPYNIFAIPCGSVHVESLKDTGGYLHVFTDEAIAYNLASTIITQFGSALYDIQLLPFCPVQELIRTDFIMRLPQDYEKIATPVIDQTTNEVKSYIFHVPKSQFTFNIPYNIDPPATAIDKKISNQCDKYRLCSPNFNGYFDFSPAKNDGVQYFNVDCCYKPYQPYIHVNPNFNGLYGEDFNDARGLICGGDFSLSQISEAWKQYQIQNKNYQETFNRQIENMEIQNNYQRLSETVGAFAGTVGGGVAGALAGNMIVPGIGAAVGGAVGGIASGLGGVADVAINQALRQETIDYTKDLFGYQLRNIQALPATLTKVSSLNNNNKIFPLLEYYTCTDREKEAFRNKLKYNGMTVMVIDTIEKYLNEDYSYIKGKLIRLLDTGIDYHIVNTIAEEINKGVYIK